jgi:hypothetical protein
MKKKLEKCNMSRKKSLDLAPKCGKDDWHGSCIFYSENKVGQPFCFILKHFDSLNRSKIKHQGDSRLRGDDKGQKNGNREDGIPDRSSRHAELDDQLPL